MNTKTEVITWEKLLTTRKPNNIDWEVFITWIVGLIFCINFWVWTIFIVLKIISLFK